MPRYQGDDVDHGEATPLVVHEAVAHEAAAHERVQGNR